MSFELEQLREQPRMIEAKGYLGKTLFLNPG